MADRRRNRRSGKPVNDERRVNIISNKDRHTRNSGETYTERDQYMTSEFPEPQRQRGQHPRRNYEERISAFLAEAKNADADHRDRRKDPSKQGRKQTRHWDAKYPKENKFKRKHTRSDSPKIPPAKSFRKDLRAKLDGSKRGDKSSKSEMPLEFTRQYLNSDMPMALQRGSAVGNDINPDQKKDLASDILRNLCEEFNGSTTLKTLCRFIHTKNIYGFSNSFDLYVFLREFEEVFNIVGDASAATVEDGELVDKGQEEHYTVSAKINFQMCRTHSTTAGSCTEGCSNLHICKFEILSTCKRGVTCFFGHNMYTEHNKTVMRKALLHRIPLYVLVKLRYRNSTTVPVICRYYNNGPRGCSKKSCPTQFLHTCNKYIQGSCSSGLSCNLSHDIKDGEIMSLLRRYGMAPKDESSEAEVLQTLRTIQRDREMPLNENRAVGTKVFHAVKRGVPDRSLLLEKITSKEKSVNPVDFLKAAGPLEKSGTPGNKPDTDNGEFTSDSKIELDKVAGSDDTQQSRRTISDEKEADFLNQEQLASSGQTIDQELGKPIDAATSEMTQCTEPDEHLNALPSENLIWEYQSDGSWCSVQDSQLLEEAYRNFIKAQKLQFSINNKTSEVNFATMTGRIMGEAPLRFRREKKPEKKDDQRVLKGDYLLVLKEDDQRVKKW